MAAEAELERIRSSRSYRWLSAVSALFCAGLLAAPVLPGQEEHPSGVSVKLAAANVLSTNTNYPALKAWLASSRPDVVAVLEVGSAWAPVLAELSEYPHQRVIARETTLASRCSRVIR